MLEVNKLTNLLHSYSVSQSLKHQQALTDLKSPKVQSEILVYTALLQFI